MENIINRKQAQTNHQIAAKIVELTKYINDEIPELKASYRLECKLEKTNSSIRDIEIERFKKQPIIEWEIAYVNENEEDLNISRKSEEIWYNKEQLEENRTYIEFLFGLREAIESMTCQNLFSRKFYSIEDESYHISSYALNGNDDTQSIETIINHFRNIEEAFKKINI